MVGLRGREGFSESRRSLIVSCAPSRGWGRCQPASHRAAPPLPAGPWALAAASRCPAHGANATNSPPAAASSALFIPPHNYLTAALVWDRCGFISSSPKGDCASAWGRRCLPVPSGRLGRRSEQEVLGLSRGQIKGREIVCKYVHFPPSGCHGQRGGDGFSGEEALGDVA